MGTSPRTGLVTQPTQLEFFKPISTGALSFIVYLVSSFLHGTLAPRDIGTPSRSTGTLEPRDIGTPCKRLSLTQHTSADLHIQPIQRCRVILRPHGCVSNTSFTQGSGCEINASHTQGSGCETNDSHTQGSGCEINASHSTSRCHLVMDSPRASRSSSHRDERWEGCRV